MEEYVCRVAQAGFYAGPVRIVALSSSEVQKTLVDPAEEIARLNRAVEMMGQSLTSGSAFGENADIMETVRMMLDDEIFLEEIRQLIRDETRSAEHAVKLTCGRYAARMEEADTEYLRARASDIAGFGEQLISVMGGTADSALEELTALVAPDISPAQMVSFDGRFIGGIVTDKGSPNSHLSILAGNLGIPYVFGNGEAVSAAAASAYIVIDGDRVIVDPDDQLKAEIEARMARRDAEKERREKMESDAVCKTKIYANIAGPEDIPQLLESGADGVGLFRTEFLFLGKDAAPSEDEQYQAYKSVLEAMGDKEVIIRTMDFGSDKRVNWFAFPQEANPALGLRGVRVSLEKKGLFHVQLRALLRAGACGNLKVMFPMIASEWEIDEIQECVEAAAAELEAQGVAYRIPELGIMIETPAAAVTADILSKKVSFFSIGTNDLTQYALALDREAQGLDRYFDAHHEAVLRLIEITVLEGHKNNVATGICGQLAANPDVIERLVAVGVDELSVPISKVRATRVNAAKAEAAVAAHAAVACPGVAGGADGVGAADAGGADGIGVADAADPVFAPVDGALIPMSEIPDPVFSSGQLGSCIGILPDNGSVFSPCDGTVVSVAETKHAVVIRSDIGKEYLLHVGIDTVKLGGKGFSVFVHEGERVSGSQKIMDADLDLISGSGYSTMVVLVKL